MDIHDCDQSQQTASSYTIVTLNDMISIIFILSLIHGSHIHTEFSAVCPPSVIASLGHTACVA